MCGIYGVVGSITKTKRHSLLACLAVLNQSRGTHSTGIAVMSKDRKHTIAKQARIASEFIRQKSFIDAMKINSLVVMGHNRLATSGPISHATAHPFRFGSLVGTHNGSVSNISQIRKLTGKDFEVDSQYLFWSLKHYNDISKFQGALTMAWFDTSDDSFILKLFRHNRPLAFGISTDGKTMVYSSELTHLVTACSIANISIGEFFECKNFTELTFRIEASKIKWSSSF